MAIRCKLFLSKQQHFQCELKKQRKKNNSITLISFDFIFKLCHAIKRNSITYTHTYTQQKLRNTQFYKFKTIRLNQHRHSHVHIHQCFSSIDIVSQNHFHSDSSIFQTSSSFYPDAFHCKNRMIDWSIDRLIH